MSWIKITCSIILLSAYVAADYAGYAGPALNGPVSEASQGIVGSAGLKVKYCITSVTGDTQICCNGADGHGSLRSIGCFTGHSTGCSMALIDWGANIAHPKVQCRGIGPGSTYTWNYQTNK